jgi:non-canonical (house-cleaning) NTP pyrophosphatase
MFLQQRRSNLTNSIKNLEERVMNQPNCLSDLWRKGAALMTVIVHLCVQVLPAYAMQEGSSDEEDEQIESGKRKRAEGKDKLLGEDIKHKKTRIDKEDENDPPHIKSVKSSKNVEFGTFLGLPPEIQAKILEFVQDPNDIASSRLVCTHMKFLRDDQVISPLSLQNSSAIATLPPSFINKKLCLSGWAPDLKSLFSLFPSNSYTLYGKVFISNLEEDLLPENLHLKIIWTAPDDKQAASKISISEKKDAKKGVIVRSRQSLWNSFIKTNFIENHVGKNYIIHNEKILSFLLDFDDGEMGRIILSRCRNGEEVREVIKAFSSIDTPELRAQVTSLLSEKILTGCQGGKQVKAVIETFSKIKAPLQRAHVASLLSKKILTLCYQEYEVRDIINAFDKIASFEQRAHVASLLSERILAQCSDGEQVKAIINAFFKIKEFEQRTHVASLLNESILARCQTGYEVGAFLEAFFKIKEFEQRTHVASLLNERTLARCQSGYEVRAFLEAFSKIKVLEQRTHVASLLSERILARCYNGEQVKAVIDAFARIKAHEQRAHIASLLSEKILERCQNAYSIVAAIEAFAKIPRFEQRAHVASLLSEKILERCKSANHVVGVIKAFATIPAVEGVHIASLLSEKILERCLDEVQVMKVIDAFAKIQQPVIRTKVFSLLNEKILTECQDGLKICERIKELAPIVEHKVREIVERRKSRGV